MKTALIILSLFGCNDAGTACTQLDVPEVRFADIAACDRQVGPAMERAQSDAYPLIIANCGSVEETVGLVLELTEPEPGGARFAEYVAVNES